MIARHHILSLLLPILLPGVTFAQAAEPFRTRNLSPVAAIFGVPAWQRQRPGFGVSWTSEIANHFLAAEVGTERISLDGETWRNSLALAYGFDNGLSVRAELPFYRVSGGSMDGFIDRWHDWFSLPEGGREASPRDVLNFSLAGSGEPFFTLTEPRSGPGDIQLGLGYRFGSNDGWQVDASVKLPTGSEPMLAGSGSTDLALTLLRPRSTALRGRGAGYFWGLGLLRTGTAAQLAYARRDIVYLGMLGGSLALGERFGLKAQLDLHTPFYRSRIDTLGASGLQGSIGGWWQWQERGWLEFAVNEDLRVNTSPDVVMHINARWAW